MKNKLHNLLREIYFKIRVLQFKLETCFWKFSSPCSNVFNKYIFYKKVKFHLDHNCNNLWIQKSMPKNSQGSHTGQLNFCNLLGRDNVCFEFLQREKALLRIPVWEKFSATKWDRCQLSIMRNFDSYSFVTVILIQKATTAGVSTCWPHVTPKMAG